LTERERREAGREGEREREGVAFTSEKHGEWYPQIDMAAGPSSHCRHGRKQGAPGNGGQRAGRK